jgi:hypothetical protein
MCDFDASCDFDRRIHTSKSHNAENSHVIQRPGALSGDRAGRPARPRILSRPSADAAAHFLGGVAAELGYRGLEAVGAEQ